ncbi:MAG: DUF4249 domain-containing protein [Saprospiraceae bacterium]
MKKALFFAIAISFAFGCEKNIVIDPPAYESKPVIECLLMPGTIPKVYLSRSVPFFNSEATPSALFLRNAEVVISGGGEQETLTVDSIYDNYFCRWQPHYGGQMATKPNVTYTLTVKIGDKTYTASTTTNVLPVEMDEVSYTNSFRDAYGEHQGVIIDFTDPAGVENFYRFHMVREVDSTVYTIDAYEYNPKCLGAGSTLIEDIGWFVYFDKNADGQISRVIMEPSHTFKQDDVAIVRLQTLDKNAAVWYDHLDKLKQASLNPFIEPGILKEFQFRGALGVFGSVNLSQEAVELVFPEDNE